VIIVASFKQETDAYKGLAAACAHYHFKFMPVNHYNTYDGRSYRPIGKAIQESLANAKVNVRQHCVVRSH